MTGKENFLRVVRHEKPERVVNGWEAAACVFDPLMAITLVAQPGKTIVDPWGVSIYWGENEPGCIPIINDKTKVCKDITCWRDYVKAPDLEIARGMDWSGALAQADAIRAQGRLVTSLMATGLFELSHYLMGFEDSLMNLLMEPEDMHDFLDYLTEYKLRYAEILVEKLHPDMVLFHDDWGSKTSLFMKPDTWREFYKPRYQKIYDFFRAQGVLIMHHADSYCAPIVPDMIDLGVDIWQGVLPTNDIPALQKQFGDRIVFMGGIDSIIDRAGWTEAEARAETRRALETYVPGGSFIPSQTYGGEGSICPGLLEVITDEISRWNAEH